MRSTHILNIQNEKKMKEKLRILAFNVVKRECNSIATQTSDLNYFFYYKHFNWNVLHFLTYHFPTTQITTKLEATAIWFCHL